MKKRSLYASMSLFLLLASTSFAENVTTTVNPPLVSVRVVNPDFALGSSAPSSGQEQLVLGPEGSEHLMMQVLSPTNTLFPNVALLNSVTHDFFIRNNLKNVVKIFRAGVQEDTLVLKEGNVGVGISSPNQKLEVDGGLKLNSSTARPACNADSRGTFWVTKGATSDHVSVCLLKQSGAYKWVTLVSGADDEHDNGNVRHKESD